MFKAGKLHLTVLEGKDLAPKDINGSSDPFLVVRHLNATGVEHSVEKSRVVQKTLHPVFNLEVVFDIKDENDIIHFECWDKDLVGKDFEGEIYLPVKELAEPFYQLTRKGNSIEKTIPLKAGSEGKKITTITGTLKISYVYVTKGAQEMEDMLQQVKLDKVNTSEIINSAEKVIQSMKNHATVREVQITGAESISKMVELTGYQLPVNFYEVIVEAMKTHAQDSQVMETLIKTVTDLFNYYYFKTAYVGHTKQAILQTCKYFVTCPQTAKYMECFQICTSVLSPEHFKGKPQQGQDDFHQLLQEGFLEGVLKSYLHDPTQRFNLYNKLAELIKKEVKRSDEEFISHLQNTNIVDILVNNVVHSNTVHAKSLEVICFIIDTATQKEGGKDAENKPVEELYQQLLQKQIIPLLFKAVCILTHSDIFSVYHEDISVASPRAQSANLSSAQNIIDNPSREDNVKSFYLVLSTLAFGLQREDCFNQAMKDKKESFHSIKRSLQKMFKYMNQQKNFFNTRLRNADVYDNIVVQLIKIASVLQDKGVDDIFFNRQSEYFILDLMLGICQAARYHGFPPFLDLAINFWLKILQSNAVKEHEAVVVENFASCFAQFLKSVITISECTGFEALIADVIKAAAALG